MPRSAIITSGTTAVAIPTAWPATRSPRGGIIAVVDSFDSMTSDRPYRQALSLDETIARLRASAGSQLDAGLVARWIGLLEAGKWPPPANELLVYPMRGEHA